MSGKFIKKKQKSKKKGLPRWLIALLVVLFALVALVVVALLEYEEEVPQTETTLPSSTGTSQSPLDEAVLQPSADIHFDLGDGLAITRMGSYAGIYMEDGSDEIVSNVMMIVVTNNGEDTLQYAQITLSGENADAEFALSTLAPGASVVVLEANRREYANAESFTEATAYNVVFFKEDLNSYSDVFQIQPLDGGFNITNISDEDITGKIAIYYKYVSGELYYGGITFRGSIDGMAAGEIRQIMSNHFSASGTAVMYITISEEG